ncbi:hypothetical protein P3S68_008129 [Capsicum galapagoense]
MILSTRIGRGRMMGTRVVVLRVLVLEGGLLPCRCRGYLGCLDQLHPLAREEDQGLVDNGTGSRISRMKKELDLLIKYVYKKSCSNDECLSQEDNQAYEDESDDDFDGVNESDSNSDNVDQSDSDPDD